MDHYDWNYFTTLADGKPYTRIFILCSPGDWPEIRDSLSGPQPWDESARSNPQVHNPACWTIRRLGVHLGALSPPYGPAVDLTAQALDRRNAPSFTGSAILDPGEPGA